MHKTNKMDKTNTTHKIHKYSTLKFIIEIQPPLLLELLFINKILLNNKLPYNV